MQIKNDEDFNTTIPALIARVRILFARFITHPALPLPWPRSAPSPAYFNVQISSLENAFRAMDKDDVKTVSLVRAARRDLKAAMGEVARYVELTVKDTNDAAMSQGLKLRRNLKKTSSRRAPLPAPVMTMDMGPDQGH